MQNVAKTCLVCFCLDVPCKMELIFSEIPENRHRATPEFLPAGGKNK